MKPNNKFSIDYLVVIFAFFTLGLSSYLLVDDKWMLAGQGSGNSVVVGEIATSVNDVRRKLNNNFVWIPAEINDRIYEGDSVFTGDESETAVRFNDGTEIGISANSLVVIRTLEKKMSLDLQFGDVIGKLNKSGGELIISSGGKQTVLNGDSAEVAISLGESGETQLRVMSGDVSLDADGKTTTLKENQAVDVSESGVGQVKQASISLLTPKFNQTLPFDGEKTIDFSWKAIESATAYQVEVSPSSGFSHSVIKRIVTEPVVNFKFLPMGQKLYWRVKAIDASKKLVGVSFPGQVKVISTIAPIPQTPQRQAEIFLDVNNSGQFLEGQEILVTWKTDQPATDYQLIIASDRKFENLVLNQRVSNPYYRLQPDNEGTFFWRVRSVITEKEYSKWSSLSEFTAKFRRPEVPLDPPQVPAEPQSFEKPFELTGNDNDHPVLRWKEIPEAKRYLIEISDSPDFTTKLTSKVVEGNQFVWEGSSSGEFFWRVAAISDSDRQGRFSEPAGLKVQVQEVPLVPATAVPMAQTPTVKEGQFSEIPLNWKPIPGAETYEVVVSDRRDFSSPLAQEDVNEPTYKFKTDQPGNYYWRVRAKRGDELGPWSASNDLSLKSASLQAIALKSTEVEKVISAYAKVPNNNGPILEWSGANDAIGYDVQIASDEAFENVVFKTSTKRTSIMWKKYRLGKYAYRVRSKSKDGRLSPYSNGVLRVKFPKKYKVRAKVNVEELLDVYDTFKVDINWDEMAFAKTYNIKVGSQPNLSDGREFNSKQLSKSYKFKEASVFYWALQPVAPNGQPLSPYSTAQKINLKLNKGLLAAPNLTAPENGSNLFFQDTRFVKFTWAKAKSASSYDLQVSTDAEFSKNLVETSVEDLRYFWQGDIANGSYFWRVRSVNKRYKSRWSNPWKFSVSGL